MWNRGNGWVTSQLQSLERVEQDVVELKRVLSDRDATANLRQQAQRNLARLGDMLQSQQPPQASPGPRDGTRLYYDESARILNDIQQSQEGLSSDQAAADSSPQEQRGLISRYNESFSLLNQIQTPAGAEPRENLNFYREDDVRRAQSKQKTVTDESQSRSRLKEQLERQVPAIQQAAPENSGASPLGRRLNEIESLGAMGGMGGGAMNLRDPLMDWEKSGLGERSSGQSSSFGINAGTSRAPKEALTPLFGAKAREDAKTEELRSEQPAQRAAGAPQETPERPWGQTGGLSLEVHLPDAGQTLTFSKIGGGPELTLHVRPQAVWGRLLGLGWCVLCMGLGVWLLRSNRRQGHPAGGTTGAR
jgi:hypothetical protein